jgi:hypothetical protein
MLIADIGGYTRFMNLHRMSLVHAQENTTRLLEALIDAVPRLELAQIEGDAAFLFAREPADEEIARSIGDVARTMHEAFHVEQDELVALTLCRCDACGQIGRLSVKVVAHVGEAIEHTIRGRTSLSGPDVILVHRLLKNSVPVSEYVLMTDPLYEQTEPSVRERAVELEEELEGLGRERVWYVELEEAARARAEASPAAKLAHAVGITARSLPYYVGLRKPLARSDA